MTDFSKAFDRVDHSIVLTKLIQMGADSSLVSWLADFLTGRSMRVKYKGERSQWSESNEGVPQGTKIGWH